MNRLGDFIPTYLGTIKWKSISEDKPPHNKTVIFLLNCDIYIMGYAYFSKNHNQYFYYDSYDDGINMNNIIAWGEFELPDQEWIDSLKRGDDDNED